MVSSQLRHLLLLLLALFVCGSKGENLSSQSLPTNTPAGDTVHIRVLPSLLNVDSEQYPLNLRLRFTESNGQVENSLHAW